MSYRLIIHPKAKLDIQGADEFEKSQEGADFE